MISWEVTALLFVVVCIPLIVIFSQATMSCSSDVIAAVSFVNAGALGSVLYVVQLNNKKEIAKKRDSQLKPRD